MSKFKKSATTTTAYIGLGSNLDKPVEQLASAVKSLNNYETITVLKISSCYNTKPVGYLEQPNFLNAVIKIKTTLSATSIMLLLLTIEKQHLRKRSNNKNMPRTLDLDLIIFGNKKISRSNLTVPHPRAKDRAFVLIPLYEIAPKLVRRFLGNTDFIKKFKFNSEFLEVINSEPQTIR